MKKYRINRGIYGGTEDSIIEVPDEMRFIFKDGSVGRRRTNGHNHYLGVAPKKCTKNSNEFFGDYMLKVFYDTKFYDDIPLISSEELTNLLSKYYIYSYIPTIIDNEYGYDEEHKTLFENDSDKIVIIPPRLFECAKLISIEGPYDITTSEVTIGSWLRYDLRPVNQMMVVQREYDYLFNHPLGHIVKEVSKDSTIFMNSVKQVMNNMQIPWQQ